MKTNFHYFTQPITNLSISITMKDSIIISSLIIFFIVLSYSCQDRSEKPIEFQVSQGVMNQMDFDTLGLQKGDNLPSLKLSTVDGEQKRFDSGPRQKPLLLINGSYTCDITRSQVPSIQRIFEKYKGEIDIYLIHTLEAHPSDTPSPYSAEPEPWLAADNIANGISAKQPKTVSQRQDLAKKWINRDKLTTPVLIDGPKNEFWQKAGEAPNMAILINKEGKVAAKQSWYQEEELEEAIQGEL